MDSSHRGRARARRAEVSRHGRNGEGCKGLCPGNEIEVVADNMSVHRIEYLITWLLLHGEREERERERGVHDCVHMGAGDKVKNMRAP